MRVPHVSSPDAYVGYYLDQAGGSNHAAYYQGARIQRGKGIGRFFGNMFRFAMPLLKRGVAHVGKALGRTGANILADAVSGSDIKDSAKTHFKSMGQGLAGDAAGYVLDRVKKDGDNQAGGRKRKRGAAKTPSAIRFPIFRQRGGYKRKRSSKNSQSKRIHKRSKVDIFSS